MSTHTNLQELFPGIWGEHQPRTLVELINADYPDLDDTAQALRKLAVTLAHSFERAPVHTARVARELLEKHHLPARAGHWTAVVLDEGRERVYIRKKGSGMRLSHAVSTRFPRIEALDEKAPLPPNGMYLLIYGGGPDVLDDETLLAYRALTSATTVADLLLWENQEDSATFWSLRAGRGSRGSEVIEFPDPETVRRWQTP
jgi:hypothetical protein